MLCTVISVEGIALNVECTNNSLQITDYSLENTVKVIQAHYQ